MIKIRNLSKNYGEQTALENVDIAIETGELFGLLGPNGAGKTTLINIINTFLKFDAGEIFIDDQALTSHSNKIKKLIGIIPQEIALYEGLTALENLKFWGEIYGLGKKNLQKKCDNILKLVGLSERKNDLLRNYSGGMKRRINIAAGLLHDPKIILMDEPTVGVDPQSRNFIFEMIEELHSQNKTIIYTTHYMEEAERLCERIAIIDHGKIIAVGTKEELYELLDQDRNITVKFQERTELSLFQKEFSDLEIKQLSAKALMIFGQDLINKLPQLIAQAKKQSQEIEEIDFGKPNLEKVFLKLTGRELRDK